MNKVNETLKHTRTTTPPPGLTADVERTVMQQVSRQRAGRFHIITKPVSITLAAAAGTAVLLLVVTHATKRVQPPAPQFVESIMVVDDHVCIWLEPVETVSGEKTR